MLHGGLVRVGCARSSDAPHAARTPTWVRPHRTSGCRITSSANHRIAATKPGSTEHEEGRPLWWDRPSCRVGNRGDMIRTCDLYVPNVALYQLSYTPVSHRQASAKAVHSGRGRKIARFRRFSPPPPWCPTERHARMLYARPFRLPPLKCRARGLPFPPPTGHSAAGSVLEWGSRGRGFESRCPDHGNEKATLTGWPSSFSGAPLVRGGATRHRGRSHLARLDPLLRQRLLDLVAVVALDLDHAVLDRAAGATGLAQALAEVFQCGFAQLHEPSH